MAHLASLAHPPPPSWSENRRKLSVIGTYLRVTPRLRLRRGWLSPRSILIVRDSPRKILAGSFLQQLRSSSISPVFQCATNTSVPPPPTRQLLPFGNTYAISHLPAPSNGASPPGLHSESKIKYLREMVNTVTGALPEVGKLEIGRVPLRRGTRRVFHDVPSSLGLRCDRDASFYFNNYVAARCSRGRKSIAHSQSRV